MRRTLERIGLVVVTALVAVSATAYASRGNSHSAGFINIPRGETARFLDTHVTCTNPKGQSPGGQVGCQVTYKYWRNALHPVAAKYDVGLTLLQCIDIGKLSRTSKLLKSGRLC
jgi:hypothetical protein